MATVWWWVVKPAEQNAASRPNDAQLVSTPDSGPAYDAWIQNGTYQGRSRFQGPFTSKADAQKAPPGGGSTLDQVKAGLGAGLQSDVGALGVANRAKNAVGNPLDFLASFLATLTDKNLWIRIVKIIAGGAMLIVGLAKLTGADKTAGSLAGKAVKVAPFL